MLQRAFYRSNTVEVPVPGGTYIEGSVGEVQPLNPWFTTTNDVNRDIESLVFAGLLRYDPKTATIVEDLATLTVSKDNRVYTVKLRDGLLWHDSTKDKVHPVTADDVLFTFKTIQEPDFPNPILHQNFRGVTVEKIDDWTVRFTLEKPYTFFTSNLTLGLLPKSAFEGVPVKILNSSGTGARAELSPAKISFTLTGSKRRLDKIEADKLLAYVDLTPAREGEQTLPVTVQLPEDITVKDSKALALKVVVKK